MGDNIFTILGFEDTEYGNIQSVDEMTILPILGEDKTKHLSDPSNVKFERTSDYGTMEFSNDDPEDDNYGIMPSNTMVLSSSAAQDHAMVETGVVKSAGETVYENACCVQSSQGGYLSGGKENSFNVLPLNLRTKLLASAIRAKREYNKLWDSIGEWLGSVPGIQHGSEHLEYFFEPFEKELEDFASEFEPVENQIGAVVFFNGKVVGVEIMPSVRYWEYYWKWLIRGCYGAELLRRKKSGMIEASKLVPQITSGNIADDMEQFMRDIRTSTVNSVNALPVARVEKSSVSYRFNSLANKLITFDNKLGGDVLEENGQSVYASIVSKVS